METIDNLPVTIANLPEDCLQEIFLLLPFIDRIRIQRVCKSWRDISHRSWHKHKTLSLDDKDWGDPRKRGKMLNLSILEDVLELCGRFVTKVKFNNNFNKDAYFFPIDEKFFSLISKMCPNIVAIVIDGVVENTKCVAYLAEMHTKLTEIQINQCFELNLDQSLALLFKRNRNLRSVRVCYSDVHAKCLLDLNPEAIEEIDVTGFIEPEDVFCSALKKFKNLKKFMISDWPCNYVDPEEDREIQEILKALKSNAENLKVLDISESPGADSEHISCFRNLEKLILYNVTVNDKFFEAVCENCTSLTDVELSCLYDVTNVGMESIAKLPKLQILRLFDITKISDDILNQLLFLKELYFFGSPKFGTSAVCKFLRASKRLKCLEISSCKNIYISDLINVVNEITESQTDGRVARFNLITESQVDPKDFQLIQNEHYKLTIYIYG